MATTLRLGRLTEGNGDRSRRRDRRRKADARVQEGMAWFQHFLTEVGAWARLNADRVAKVYLAPDGDLNLYVVGRSAAYDFTLRSLLTDLVASLKEQRYPVYGSVIPGGNDDELRAFFNPDGAFVLQPE
jgi:hypothetical protein